MNTDSGSLYMSGVAALNIKCGDLDVTGDWHRLSINWDKLKLSDMNKSHFGDWGIERNIWIPELESYYNVANVLRACIDMIDSANWYGVFGMHDDYIGNDLYNDIIFSKVLYMRSWKTEREWNSIHSFMIKEYRLSWIRFLYSPLTPATGLEPMPR